LLVAFMCMLVSHGVWGGWGGEGGGECGGGGAVYEPNMLLGGLVTVHWDTGLRCGRWGGVNLCGTVSEGFRRGVGGAGGGVYGRGGLGGGGGGLLRDGQMWGR